MEKESKEITKEDLKSFLIDIAIIIPVSIFITGYTVMTIWNWFVPYEINIFRALGFAMLVGVLKTGLKPVKEKEKKTTKQKIKDLFNKATFACVGIGLSYLFYLGL